VEGLHDRREPADLLISGGTIVTQNQAREVIAEGAVVIRDDRIVAVGTRAALGSQYEARRVIDAAGRYVFPGLINTHTHLFQTFMKGLGEGLPLYEWIDRVTAPSTVAMTPHEAYLAAVLGGIEALRSGATTVLDFMYSMPRTDLYRSVARGLGDLGLRGVLARGFMDYGTHHGMPLCQLHPVKLALSEWDALRAELAAPLLTFALAPEIPFAVSRESLIALRTYADRHGLLITIHINENDDDDRAMLADYGQRAIPCLEDLGFWGPDVLAVHCVRMQPEDIAIFARRDVKVSHNPVSNMYLGVGIAPVQAMRRAGLTIGLGTDGAASNNCQDMIETLKVAALLQKVAQGSAAAITAAETLDMATIDGARAIGQAGRLGSLESGKQADLFILDPLRARSTPVFDPVGTLVYSAGSTNVSTVVVAGRLVLDEDRITGVDEAALLAACQEAAWDLARRVGTGTLLPPFPPPATITSLQ
jgi:5-methylthioadenosine/S-adenosylhomocysteine deaminase